MTFDQPLLTPLDWAAYAQREANELTGTCDGSFEQKMVEYRRYMAFAAFMKYVKEKYNDEYITHLR